MPDPVNSAATPAPFARTKEDNTTVLAMFKPFASLSSVQALQTEVLADPALTIEQIQARLLTEIGKGAQPANPAGAHPRVETVEDEADKRRDAIVAALRVRANVETDAKVRAEVARGNPFRGQKLLDIARASLHRAGIKTDGMSQMEVVAAAFTQGTSDFPVLLESAMHKTLQAAYARAPLTWNRFCRTGTVSDFRTHSRYRTGSFGALDAVTELGEYVNKSIPDGEKATISVDTKGNVINLSRKAIINDDLGAFVGLADSLGMAAARSVEIDVYALLALNSGLGPTQSDSQPLFHSNRANVNATGSALTTAGIDADAAVMAAQKDVSGNDYLDLRPAVLLVPRSLEGTGRVVNGSEYDPDANNKLQRPNIVRGMFTDIVGTPRLTGTRRYLFADPNVAPVLEVAFLDGQSEPFMEMQDGFDVDGARWKVRLDYGVAAVDFRGAVTNAGQ
jgi:phage major head subunit gpT-like protein